MIKIIAITLNELLRGRKYDNNYSFNFSLVGVSEEATLSPNGVVVQVAVVQVSYLHPRPLTPSRLTAASTPTSRRYYQFAPSHFLRKLNRPIDFAYYFFGGGICR